MGGGGEPLGCCGSLRRKFIVQPRKNTKNKLKKAPTLPGSFYMIMPRTIGWVGRSALRTPGGASPPGPGTMLSHLALELGPENQTMRGGVLIKDRVCLLREMTMASGLGHINSDPKVNEGKTGP